MEQQKIWIQTDKKVYGCIDLCDVIEFQSKPLTDPIKDRKIKTELVIFTKDAEEITISEQYKGKPSFLFESFVEYIQHRNRDLAYDELRKKIIKYNNTISHQYYLETARKWLQQQVDNEEKS